MEYVSTPNPHFIPGYTGFCPQYRYHIGDTYGTTTHKLLLDPNVDHAEKLVLSENTANDYQILRPEKKVIDRVNERGKYVESLYKHPMIPGYEGLVPREQMKFGQRYSVQATEAVSEFEQIQQNYDNAFTDLEKLVKKQDAKNYSNLSPDILKKLSQSPFKMPLNEVRPEYGSLLRTLPTDKPSGKPPRNCNTADFLYDTNPVEKGYKSDAPFGCACYGKTNEQLKDSPTCDFVSTYRKRLSTEWAPAHASRPDPPFLIQTCKIYHKHIGQLPNYMGHIPGSQFRYGKTYGNETRDAKRWIRGDFRI